MHPPYCGDLFIQRNRPKSARSTLFIRAMTIKIACFHDTNQLQKIKAKLKMARSLLVPCVAHLFETRSLQLRLSSDAGHAPVSLLCIYIDFVVDVRGVRGARTSWCVWVDGSWSCHICTVSWVGGYCCCVRQALSFCI